MCYIVSWLLKVVFSLNSEFRSRSSSVHQIYTEFLDSRTRYIELLDRYIYFSNFFQGNPLTGVDEMTLVC